MQKKCERCGAIKEALPTKQSAFRQVRHYFLNTCKKCENAARTRKSQKEKEQLKEKPYKYIPLEELDRHIHAGLCCYGFFTTSRCNSKAVYANGLYRVCDKHKLVSKDPQLQKITKQ